MQIGAIIENGPVNWQIIQQINGKADICLSGIWVYDELFSDSRVHVRILKEETGEVVVPWHQSEDCGKCKWKIILSDVLAGGLYRIETCLNHDNSNVLEWALRGDMIHHLGIGDIYIITGQSNSAGYGRDPVYDPPEIGVHILKNNGKWDIASHPMNESTNTIHEENREESNPGHSPYLSFARNLKRGLGYPIGLIQASLGGSTLSLWNAEESGVLYRNALIILGSQGCKIKGVLWYQGCSDTAEGLCDTYLNRFKCIVLHLRKDLKDENLPILTVQLNRRVSPADETMNRCWGKIREAQRQAAKQIPNVFIIPSNDCSLSDTIHNSSVSNMVIGERLSKIALNKIYGRKLTCNAPDIAEAKKVDKDKIILIFDNVYSRLYSYGVGAAELPFIIEDERGVANIKSYENNTDNTIIVTLDRELGKCKVHGASEQNPKAIIPVDYESHLPMFSFYGVEVTENI